MARRSDFEVLMIQTKNISLIWKDVHGIASCDVANKLDIAMLDWQYELTESLKIWIDKGLKMTTGELILARANLGAVVESWLRFFYCVFYDDYMKQPKVNKKGHVLEPEKDLRFEDLKTFSTGILWDDENSDDYKWVDSVQKKRNAIHSFTYKDIGTPLDFLHDVCYLCKFVDMILNHLPPVEEYIECYPEGYVLNVYYE